MSELRSRRRDDSTKDNESNNTHATLANLAGTEQSNSDNQGDNVLAELPYNANHVEMNQNDKKKNELNRRKNDEEQGNVGSDRGIEPTIELAEGEQPVSDDHYRFAELPDLTSPTVEVGEPEEGQQQKKKKTAVLKENKIAISFIIIPMAILGTLIRIGLQRLQTYDGQPVFALVYAQWVGCFIMGMVVQKKDALMQWYLPLHVGLSTGLCGSITTFSSWQLDIFKAFSNYDAAAHYRGYNILAAISQLLVTFAMSLNGLVFGYHIGQLLSHLSFIHSNTLFEINPRGFSIRYLNRHDVLIIIIGTLSWFGVILAAALTKYQRSLTLACVFAPLGALLRWHLSVLNTRIWKDHFFLGTLAANMIGTLVLAVVTLLQSGVGMSSIACDVLHGIGDGFCGCLTTISTFMLELSNLPLKYTYRYGLISVILGQCFMFLICGTYIWTHGVNPSCPPT